MNARTKIADLLVSAAGEPLSLTDSQSNAVAQLRERFPDLQHLQPMLAGDGAIVARSPKANLWFAIETDGYVHT